MDLSLLSVTVVLIYTVNHKKRDILFLTITLVSFGQNVVNHDLNLLYSVIDRQAV